MHWWRCASAFCELSRSGQVSICDALFAPLCATRACRSMQNLCTRATRVPSGECAFAPAAAGELRCFSSPAGRPTASFPATCCSSRAFRWCQRRWEPRVKKRRPDQGCHKDSSMLWLRCAPVAGLMLVALAAAAAAKPVNVTANQTAAATGANVTTANVTANQTAAATGANDTAANVTANQTAAATGAPPLHAGSVAACSAGSGGGNGSNCSCPAGMWESGGLCRCTDMHACIRTYVRTYLHTYRHT